LGEFLPDGRLFTLGTFVKIQLFLPRKKLCFNFAQKLVGANFGRFFYKLIWSPCMGGMWIGNKHFAKEQVVSFLHFPSNEMSACKSFALK
jgi:hypothetical protein